MTAGLGRLILYTHRLEATAAFYSRYFGYEVHRQDGDRIVELRPPASGAVLMLHPAAKGQRQGQSLVKLVFDVKDVEAFCAAAKADGLTFGPIHKAEGYLFANAKDPSGNSISVSSRAFAQGSEKAG
ncbi:VOC family protein [Rhodalgimonas zhirmunskyi]|uniref:VOC family protein n=1 Tax=Rhodalgimonas zhirmunskyi TaxID=2964767 RepID=A0AAJ1U4H0_9RHOB|nr:VOC family protein [Rhodoalgimonas zhirmunskyi]MDQ2092819.1 VOC family protein [Rhodoalgimonas zhirmunskyi]